MTRSRSGVESPAFPLFAETVFVCLDTDDADEIIHPMLQRPELEQVRPLRKNKNHPIARHLLPQPFDLQHQKSCTRITATRHDLPKRYNDKIKR